MNRTTSKITAITLMILSLAPFTPAMGADRTVKETLSLAEAVETALANSSFLKQVDSMGSAQEARRKEASSLKMPRVDLSSSFMAGNNPVFVFGSLLEQSKFGADRFQIDKLNDPNPITNFRTDLRFGVPLYDANGREVAVASAEHGIEGAKAQRAAAESELRLMVTRAYFGVLFTSEREKATAEAISSAQADVKRAKDLQETGMIVKADLLALEVQLAEMNQQAIEAKAESAIARAGLANLLGYPEETALKLTTQLAPRVFTLPKADEVGSSARANRIEPRAAEVEIKKAADGVRAAKSQILPRVEAFGNYGFSSRSIGLDSTDWTLGVRLTVPIFDEGIDSRTDQALAYESGAKAMRQAQLDRVSMEAFAAYKRVAASQERLLVAAAAVEQAREARRIGQDRYQVGLTTVTEVLRAQTAELRAHLGEAAARYGVYTDYAQFLYATGSLADFKVFE